MNMEAGGLLLALSIPWVLFLLGFRKSWSDRDLLKAALSGFVGGALVVLPLKFLVYPLIQFLLGIDLRILIAESQELTVQVAGCMGIVGPIEETAKLVTVLSGLAWMGLINRPAAVFLGALAGGLGFALLENLDYYSLVGWQVFVMREILCTAGHLGFSGLVGFGAAQALTVHGMRGFRGLVRGFSWLLGFLAIGSALHGLYDVMTFRLTQENAFWLLGCGVLFCLVILRELWTRILVLDLLPERLSWACPGCGNRKAGRERFCPSCGKRVQVVSTAEPVLA